MTESEDVRRDLEQFLVRERARRMYRLPRHLLELLSLLLLEEELLLDVVLLLEDLIVLMLVERAGREGGREGRGRRGSVETEGLRGEAGSAVKREVGEGRGRAGVEVERGRNERGRRGRSEGEALQVARECLRLVLRGLRDDSSSTMRLDSEGRRVAVGEAVSGIGGVVASEDGVRGSGSSLKGLDVLRVGKGQRGQPSI